MQAATSVRAPKTRTEVLRQQLADEIVQGTIAPGAALDEASLARRFNVSRTPVREAPAHRAAVVARPSETRLVGMFAVMAELEALSARFAAERMDARERNSLEVIHAELRALIRASDPQRYYEVNEAFHNAIYAGAH